MKEKEIVVNFLKKHEIDNFSKKIMQLDDYVKLLQEYNQRVNLISRQADEGVIWLTHILDSLLPISKFNLSGKTVLDFGTGGGLPGIPLQIIFPKAFIYLLDSNHKKIAVLKNVIKKLDLKQCLTISTRIEDMEKTWNNYFDVVVSRSVKLDIMHLGIIRRLVRKNGRICMYKAKKLFDREIMKLVEIHDISHKSVGTRNLLIMRKENVPRGT